jgi:hypothetical protein
VTSGRSRGFRSRLRVDWPPELSFHRPVDIARVPSRGYAASEVETGLLHEGTHRGGEHRRFICVSGVCSRASLPNPSPIQLPAPQRRRLRVDIARPSIVSEPGSSALRDSVRSTGVVSVDRAAGLSAASVSSARSRIERRQNPGLSLPRTPRLRSCCGGSPDFAAAQSGLRLVLATAPSGIGSASTQD